MEDLVGYFDGDFIRASEIAIPVESLGFTRGYGAYECFRTYGQEPFRLGDHLKRLKATCEKLLIPYPCEDFEQLVALLIEKNPGNDLIFRLYVTDSTKGKSYQLVILCNTLAAFEHSNPCHPLALKTIVDRRENVGIKSTAYGYTITAMKQAEALGFDSILLIGEDGNIHELGKANFFAVRGRLLYTPDKHLLLGITRKTILEIAKDFGYEVVEGDIHLSFLKDVDEVFSCATIRGIVSIRKIDQMIFSSDQHARKLQTYFQSLSKKACV